MSDVDQQLSDLVLVDARSIAGRLRRLAEQIEERAERGVGRNLRDLRPDHAALAERIVHDVASAIPNLGLDRLISNAAEADRHVRKDPTCR